ncbi:MAG TPA: TetR/AcrR family transcriptional regulator [Chitinophagales bacterium]|nr:TetR/AcrR family transcriptional regulator [Chitinophagales bacterium]HMX03662.1 TetR/AcrR family transcriptional regulator [Chitinophagales bacterium]HNE46850.1 TetR/AcrR family transcriptional regulator [Chitinophagales bacterium]HNF69692.1 TetR/AcrR family transcriptional regulator [Chitinophagales bacterium]HNI54671.1 TetR/AcrR family transcriptional regulator [Chitinophagales bacterium]
MPVKKIDRGELIKQALNLFRTQGYHKTTMSDIGTACGLLKGSIYHYFSSKEDLMREVLEVLRNYYRDKVFIHAFNDALTAEQRLNMLGEKSIEVFVNGDGACLMANIAMETNDVVPEFRAPIRAFFDDWTNALTHIYSDKYSKEAATIFAGETICAIEGAAMLMRIYNDRTYLDKAHQMITEKFKVGSKAALLK